MSGAFLLRRRKLGPMFKLASAVIRQGNSKLAEQNQDQHDNEYEAESAAAVVTGPIEGAAPEPAKAPEQRDYQNDEQDGSKRHRIISLVGLLSVASAQRPRTSN